ncbi:LysR family transcriptional regulator [Paucibacter sp. APW11]|uniref:LysR family transcriptional regulator n=1 Tax=Roseateles aquae TaxID=3077235 RepID=A0ABU3PA59_9BURK|nr:LysR family transcriptional regulator [Paucibacter sp. APW11]MDT8999419.1 LysR family transcriptional regulator [Paucibacter sp. APW11]
MKSQHAKTQYKLSPDDLGLVLALSRGATLAKAGERLGVDASTVFRAVQRLERGLGQRLFERSRSGYRPTELASLLAGHGEQLEAQLEQARAVLQAPSDEVSGTVRISSTDTLLHGLLAPALLSLRSRHPLIAFELHTGNELANLSRRDADIALRATRRPPPHLVGRRIGDIQVALYAASDQAALLDLDDALAGHSPWIAPDDALPEHPSVLWRRKQLPRLLPQYKVNSIQSVMELVAAGLGVGLLPMFLAEGRSGLTRLSEPIADCSSELWLLCLAEARHLRRVATVYSHLAEQLRLA